MCGLLIMLTEGFVSKRTYLLKGSKYLRNAGFAVTVITGSTTTTETIAASASTTATMIV